jgi:hypothetical protein
VDRAAARIPWFVGIWVWALLITAVLALCCVLLVCWTRLERLHRLHRRTDAARAGLERALQQRAEVARAVADLLPEPAAAGLREAVAGCGAAGPPGIDGSDRDAAENVLGRRLAALDRLRLPAAVRAELHDAEQLLIVARSVHNDAVRDTLVLRSRRLVRWLRLAGTAPLPTYFEIADPAPDARPPAPRVIGGTAVPPPR